jgi:hypothetical protein
VTKRRETPSGRPLAALDSARALPDLL